MTSSILRPRRSRTWLEPSTHLRASTMLVLPEPFGPTMAVTPPSNRISVGRANVLNPTRFNERSSNFAATVADMGVIRALGTTCGSLLERLSELPAGRRLWRPRLRRPWLRLRCRSRSRLRYYADGRQRSKPSSRSVRSLVARRSAGAGPRRLDRLPCSRLQRSEQLLEGRACRLLLSLLLGSTMPRAERFGTREHHRRVLAVTANAGSLAVVDGRMPEPLLGDLLQATLEVLVLHRFGQRTVSIQVVVIGRVVAGVEEHGAENSL